MAMAPPLAAAPPPMAVSYAYPPAAGSAPPAAPPAAAPAAAAAAAAGTATLQARLATLEKEARSSAMRLQFMNRQHSEMTLKIESREERNAALTKENVRLRGLWGASCWQGVRPCALWLAAVCIWRLRGMRRAESAQVFLDQGAGI